MRYSAGEVLILTHLPYTEIAKALNVSVSRINRISRGAKLFDRERTLLASLAMIDPSEIKGIYRPMILRASDGLTEDSKSTSHTLDRVLRFRPYKID